MKGNKPWWGNQGMLLSKKKKKDDVWQNLGPTGSLQQVGDAAKCRTSGMNRRWLTHPVGSRHTQPQGKKRKEEEEERDWVNALYKERYTWTWGGGQNSSWPITSLHSFCPETLSERVDRWSQRLLFISSFSSALMSAGRVSNLAACFTSHTAPVQNSYRPPDGGAAFLLAVSRLQTPAVS